MKFESFKKWKIENLNESEESILQQGGIGSNYEWIKTELEEGKLEVTVGMSYCDFEPGYYFSTPIESTKDFPGMYGEIETEKSSREAPKEKLPYGIKIKTKG